MKKLELIEKLNNEFVKVILVQEEADSEKNAAGVKMYSANCMESDGEKVGVRNIGFYVIDEGKPTEEAFLRDAVAKENTTWKAINEYLYLLTPGTFLSYKIIEVDEKFNIGRAQVLEISGEDVKEKNIAVYFGKDGYTHKIVI